MTCKNCSSAEHQSSTCLQAEVCPTCKTKNHSWKYICPMLKEVKKEERDNRGYTDDSYPEQVCQVNERAANSYPYSV